MNKKTRAFSKMIQLEAELKYITKDLQEIEDSWPDHFNEDDPQDMYLRSSFSRIEEKLSDVQIMIKRMNAEIIAEGRLWRNSDGRYEIEGTDYYFTSGEYIEVLYAGEWIPSTIEHNGTDYYLTALDYMMMKGIIARAKRYTLWED